MERNAKKDLFFFFLIVILALPTVAFTGLLASEGVMAQSYTYGQAQKFKCEAEYNLVFVEKVTLKSFYPFTVTPQGEDLIFATKDGQSLFSLVLKPGIYRFYCKGDLWLYSDKGNTTVSFPNKDKFTVFLLPTFLSVVCFGLVIHIITLASTHTKKDS